MPEDVADNTEETFVVTGEARTVLEAHDEAWQALELRRGRDPIDAWSLAKIAHTHEDEGLTFTATFRRNPSVDVPPLSDEEVQQRVNDLNAKVSKGDDNA